MVKELTFFNNRLFCIDKTGLTYRLVGIYRFQIYKYKSESEAFFNLFFIIVGGQGGYGGGGYGGQGGYGGGYGGQGGYGGGAGGYGGGYGGGAGGYGGGTVLILHFGL